MHCFATDEGRRAFFMNLIFEPAKGKPFSMEVGYFDTVLEIKEKIQKKYVVPVAKQTLIFHGQILRNDLNVRYSDILDRSKFQLHVTHESPVATKIQVLLKMPDASKGSVAVEMDNRDTIRRLKEKIHEMESGVPVNRLVVRANGVELLDQRSLHDCQIGDRSEVQVGVKSSSTRKLRVMVLTRCGTKKVTVQVNAWDKVGVLREELEKLKQRISFPLPEEGYFFIHKRNVMEDDRSFRWHHVVQGDTIEIFNGRVTRRS